MINRKHLFGLGFLFFAAAVIVSYYNVSQWQRCAYQFIYDVDLSNYSSRAFLSTTNQSTRVSDADFAKVDVAIHEKRRIAALSSCQTMLDEDPGNVEVLLRMGIIYLQENQFAVAEECLKKVYTASESVSALDGAWFLGLLYAQKGLHGAANALFEEVVAGRGNYHVRAQELLRLMA